MMKNMLFLVCMMLASQFLQAAPGAHGPNGEHLDSPAAAGLQEAETPRTETFNQQFELVARLYDTELSVMVDDYATNVPVLNAQLELQVGDLRSKAMFHQDAGDYAFDDPALLQVLKQPGRHELVFSLGKTHEGKPPVILTALLDTAAAANAQREHEHAHDHDEAHAHWIDELSHSPFAWIGLAVGLLAGLVAIITVGRRRHGHAARVNLKKKSS